MREKAFPVLVYIKNKFWNHARDQCCVELDVQKRISRSILRIK